MNLIDFFEAQITKLPVSTDPSKDYAIYVDNRPVVKFSDKAEALSTLNDLKSQFPQSQVELRPMAKMSESSVNVNTARAIAGELRDLIVDYMDLQQAGGNVKSVTKIRDRIVDLASQLQDLGYDIDLQSPNLIRPTTVDVDAQQTLHEIRCVKCGGPARVNSQLDEKKDSCYYKVRSRYRIWPSAYASGALVQCRKKGAKNWGKSKAK